MNPSAIEPRNGFFAAIDAMSETEIRPGNTVTLLHEVDLTEIEILRKRAASAGRLKPSYTAFVVKAAVTALREFSYANRRIVRLPFFGKRIQRFHNVDAAVACERNVPEAPMTAFVDVIRTADGLTVEQLTARLRAFAEADLKTNKQWRDFHFLATKLPIWLSRWLVRLPVYFPNLWLKYRGGALLVSSPAKYGVDMIAATWPWPVGVSFGVVKQRAVVREGRLTVRPTFFFTLNFDRRIMAGAQAAKFFKRIVDFLENAGNELSDATSLPPRERQRAERAITSTAEAAELKKASV